MTIAVRALTESDAADASAVVQASFREFVAKDWELSAQERFFLRTSPEGLREKLGEAALATGAFCGSEMVGVLLMPEPSLIGLLFVHPQWLRRGIARSLWMHARARIADIFPDTETIEANATPHAVRFYRSMGFVPLSTQFLRDGQRAIRMACWLPAKNLAAAIPRFTCD